MRMHMHMHMRMHMHMCMHGKGAFALTPKRLPKRGARKGDITAA